MVATGCRQRGRLVLVGSGETASTMVEMHRRVLAAAGEGRCLILDTPYGFQDNAEAVTAKTVTYFHHSVGRAVSPLRWRTRLSGLELDRTLTTVRGAAAVYAGPGSPSYAARVWNDSGFTEAIGAVVDAGGTATFSSAAAIALGVVAMPTHEIYRCGADPYWLAGTDVLAHVAGIPAAIVPHYDLAPKNGSHDTRRCYIGERRMRVLEQQLPPGAHVLGIDEHTALVLDLSAHTARVYGRGGVTIRRDRDTEVLPAGSLVPLRALAPCGTAPSATTVTAHPRTPKTPEAPEAAEIDTTEPVVTDLDAQAQAAHQHFRAAVDDREAQHAAATMLDLEQSVADTTLSWADPSAALRARRVLRGMILQLADAAADGLADPRTLLAPLVEALLEQRSAARARRDYVAADHMRNRLIDAGVQVRDTPNTVEWSLTPPHHPRTRR